MKFNKYTYYTLILSAFIALGANSAFAADLNVNANVNVQGNQEHKGNMGNRPMMGPSIFGTVTAVNANTLTVNGKQAFVKDAASTTFTVDATNAKVMKNKTVGTFSSIVVGDTVMIQGTINGSNVVALSIRDGVMMRAPGYMRMNGKDGKEGWENGMASSTGNGQPVVAGSVTSITGSTIVITNKSGVTYTIDATNAKFTDGPKASTLSDVKVGDAVVVQGTINGNAVVASSVMDQARPADSNDSQGKPKPRGFFGGIGAWFSHLFGF